jgi:hypothetical protein
VSFHPPLHANLAGFPQAVHGVVVLGEWDYSGTTKSRQTSHSVIDCGSVLGVDEFLRTRRCT